MDFTRVFCEVLDEFNKFINIPSTSSSTSIREVWRPNVLLTKGALADALTSGGRKALGISKWLTRAVDFHKSTKRGKAPPNDGLCIEILEEAERRPPLLREASAALAKVEYNLQMLSSYLESRVALAKFLFPAEAKWTLVFARVYDTSDFALPMVNSTSMAGAERKTVYLDDVPFKIKDQHLNRIMALIKTVELEKLFLPRCSELLNGIMDNNDLSVLALTQNDTQGGHRLKKRRYMEFKEDFIRAFREDKEEFNKFIGVPCTSSLTSIRGVGRPSVLLTKGAQADALTSDGRKALGISKRLTRAAVYHKSGKRGKAPPEDGCSIEILEQAERRPPLLGEASASLAKFEYNLQMKLLSLESRVALAKFLFPTEAKGTLVIARVYDTSDFALPMVNSTSMAGAERKTVYLDDVPFKIKDQHLNRIMALIKTVELEKLFLPRCSELLNGIMDNNDLSVLALTQNDTQGVHRLKKRRYMEFKEDFTRAFREDKEEFNKFINILSKSSSTSIRGVGRPNVLLTKGAQEDGISNRLTRAADYYMSTERGKGSPNDELCIEISEEAERRPPLLGEGSASLAKLGDDLQMMSSSLESRDICFSSVYNKDEAAGGSFKWEGASFKWAFQLEGATTQSTAYPYLNTPVFPQPQIASAEVLSENMGSSKDKRKLLASQAEDFLEGHVSESSNLTFPACSDAAARSQPVTTILHTMHVIPHMIPSLTEGSSETSPLEGQSMQPTAYQNHNALEFPQPQIELTQLRMENVGSSEDWRASQQEPFLEGHMSRSIISTVPTYSGPSPSRPPMPTAPYTMHRIPPMMPPLTSSQDASSVKLKATYRDTIIEFQIPLASGIIELKEEVATILKLELDSFDMKYKDEEGEGDWILVPCDKDLRNYLQLFSSLVNPGIRLLVLDKDANLMNLDPMVLKQPVTFVESGTDPDNTSTISDSLRLVSTEEIYKEAGKSWTRFYLLYEPPGADRSSLIAAMANYLEFDIYDLDLKSMSSITELKNSLLSTSNRSLIVIQYIDHCAGMLPNLKNEQLMVSCLLMYVDGLFSRCGDEQIIVFFTNHRDRRDAALLPLVNMDIYIPASSPQPIALPDGGEIVQLEPSEQNATNNSEYHSNVLVSSSKINSKREASKRQCMTECVLLVDPTTRISSTKFDAPKNRAHLMRACRGGPIMPNSEKKDTGVGLKEDFLTKSILSLDDSTKQKSLPDFDATENNVHLFKAFRSGPGVSLLENKNRGDAFKRECITKSILGLEDLQPHSGGRRDNAAKSFTAIYDPGIHRTDSLAQKSFKVLETLRPREQPRNATDTEREREIWTRMCLEQSNARGAHSILANTHDRQFLAHIFLSLCTSICIRSIFGELPHDFVPLLSLRRLTLKGCARKEKSQYLSRLLQINAVEPGLTKSRRYPGGSFAKSALRGPISLQDGTHIVPLDPSKQSTKNVAHQCSLIASLPEKKMVRRTLKRKYRVISVMFENQLHFGRRFEGAAKSFSATRICRKHGINRVSRVKRIHKQQGIQQWPYRQSALGLPEKKIVRKTLKIKSRTMSVISLEDPHQHVGRRLEDDAKFLGKQNCSFLCIGGAQAAKRICRQLAIDSRSIEKSIRRQDGTRWCQFKQSALDLPDWGHMLSLSKKKIVRKTLKRKCRNMSVLRSEYHQHVDSKWEDAVKSLGGAHAAKHIYRQLVIHRVSRAKRIRRQHGFHRWPFQQNWATLKGYFLGDERPVDVISLSMDGKLVSRFQPIHVSWLGIFSPWPPALPPGGEIVGPPLALSSSQLPYTSNRPQLGGQDWSGSTASHSENERTTEPEPKGHKRKIKLTIEDLRPHVGLKCAVAAKKFQISQTTFKRYCRELGIRQWPDLPIGEVLKPPDPPERNTRQIEMVNEAVHLPEPIEARKPPDPHERTTRETEIENEVVVHLPEPIEVSRPPDPRERNTRQTEVENVVVHHVHEPNHRRDYFDSLCRSEENDSTDLQSFLQEIEAIQVIEESPLSTTYPNPNPNSLCRSEENDSMDFQSVLQEIEAIQVIEESPLSTAYPNPNLDVPLHPQVVSTQMVSGNTGIPNDQRNLLSFQAETHLERRGTGTTCSNPASSQDTSSVMLKVYGLRKEIIRFQFPLTSGIDELKGEVAMRLKLQQDIFDLHYEDDEGDKILIPIDKDLTNYLSSSVNPVIKLWVVPSPTDLCGNCGASLKR